MENLKEIRDAECEHLVQIQRLKDTFTMLSYFLPEGYLSSEELDATNVFDITYRKLTDKAEDCSQDVASSQGGFKKGLLVDVSNFKVDMKRFRDEWLNKGAMGDVEPNLAIDRLGRFREGFNIRERKKDLYQGGERLFKLPVTTYEEVPITSKELGQCENLFGLFTDVNVAIDTWKGLTWAQVLPM